MRSLTLGYSPCPNDTFIFYAMIHGKVNTKSFQFHEILLDVETLNKKALHSELDVSKISYAVSGHLRDKYYLLKAGGALGRGCGPLVISKNDFSMKELLNKKIAIPGKLTTAYMLLMLYYSSLGPLPSSLIVMPFDKIIEAVADEYVDAGLIIHESRFTYQTFDLKKIIDLGDWWERETGLLIPLGGIMARRSLGDVVIREIDEVIRQSIAYSFNNRTESMVYVKDHSQELSDEVIRKHIDLYVNEFSLNLGNEGELAVIELMSRAGKAGIIPESARPVFI